MGADAERGGGPATSEPSAPDPGRPKPSKVAALMSAENDYLLLLLDAAAGAASWPHVATRLLDLVGAQPIAFFDYHPTSSQFGVLAISGPADGALLAIAEQEIRGARLDRPDESALRPEKWQTVVDRRQYVARRPIIAADPRYFCVSCGGPGLPRPLLAEASRKIEPIDPSSCADSRNHASPVHCSWPSRR